MRIDAIQSSPIVERLLTAFRHTECPGKVAFPDSFDSEAHDEVRQLRGRVWQELEVEDLLNWASALDWLSADALRYYLPAYLAAAVAFPQVARSVSDAVIRQLAPPNRHYTKGKVRFDEMAQGLTAAQVSVIRDCLRQLGVDLNTGVFSYWEQTDTH
jgi:hypothetical protein